MNPPGFATITIGTSKAAQDLELASFFEKLGTQTLENMGKFGKYRVFRQRWLLLGIKLMEIISNLLPRVKDSSQIDGKVCQSLFPSEGR